MDLKIAALGAVAAVGGGAYMIGSPDRGEYYEMAPSEVASRLASASTPGGLSDGYSGGSVTFAARKYGESEVRWEISFIGSPVAEFSAELEEQGKGTVVHVDFNFVENSMGDAARQDLGDAEELFGAVLRLGMLEHVDSTLETRPFDKNRLQKEIAVYAINNPGAVKDYMRRVQEIEQSGGSLALEYELEDRVLADAGWNRQGRGEFPKGADVSPDRDYAMGEDPSAAIDDAKGEDPSGTAATGTNPSGGWGN